MSDIDIDYIRNRARTEMVMVAEAKCTPSRCAHLDLERRYLVLCSGVARAADCDHCDLRPECEAMLSIRSAA